MAEARDFPHLLFYGPPGSGRRTRVMAFLCEVFGPGASRVRVEQREFALPGSRVVQLTTTSSTYHVELNPGDAGIHDRLVVQQLIKEMASSAPLEVGGQRAFRVILLQDVDSLSRDAQHALRRTMEKYSPVCRLLLMCNSISRVLEPIRSRCLPLRVPAPTDREVADLVVRVCAKEGGRMPDSLALSVARASDRNMRRALLMAEAMRVQQFPYTEDQTVVFPDWLQFIVLTARKILEERTPARLLEVRNRLYDLLSHCIPPEIIIRHLALELAKKVDDEIRPSVFRYAAYYETRMRLGSKAIYHLEAFVAKFMSTYEHHLATYI